MGASVHRPFVIGGGPRAHVGSVLAAVTGGRAIPRSLKVLCVSDTHVGYDHPIRARVERRRRGPDFLANFERALLPAHRGEVDLVIHGGDLFHRSRPPAPIVAAGLDCLLRVAERGIPVFVVPGNHERSRLPGPLLQRHPFLHVFDEARTYVRSIAGARVALAGFPFVRTVGGPAFAAHLDATGWRDVDADVRLLCLHQAVEGARVGVHDYCFRPGHEVVSADAIPRGFAAVVSGHIHRHQILAQDRRGRQLPTPVLYPGAIERTSFQERREAKGYLVLDVLPGPGGGTLRSTRFVRLPARPMFVRPLDVADVDAHVLEDRIRRVLHGLPDDAIVRLEPRGTPRREAGGVLRAPSLRCLAPPTMNLDLPFRVTERVAHAAR